MLRPAALILALSALPALACETPVCVVPPEDLPLARVITFDDQPSSFGVGRPIEGMLIQPGAVFGERFAGQALEAEGDFDRVTGTALAPLTILPGAPNQQLGILRLMRTSVLQGHGPRGYPRAEAVGEGAVAVLFDDDHAALGLDIRGGEAGTASVTFLRRDGSVIHTVTLGPLAEDSYAFRRRDDQADIAGMLILNQDPEGIALDNIRFGLAITLGALFSRPKGRL